MRRADPAHARRRAAGLPAIDIILLFAAAEADLPKIEEARAWRSSVADVRCR
jgi:hypothetical protein